jgi:hypothetical protein
VHDGEHPPNQRARETAIKVCAFSAVCCAPVLLLIARHANSDELALQFFLGWLAVNVLMAQLLVRGTFPIVRKPLAGATQSPLGRWFKAGEVALVVIAGLFALTLL